MNRPLPTILLLALLSVLSARSNDEIPGLPQKQPVVLLNGSVHTGTGFVLKGASIVFDSGRIVAVGTQLVTPKGAVEIDCQGKNVYPGFIAPNTTLGLTEIDAVRSTRDMTEVGSVNPNARAEAAYNPDSEIIPTVRSHGVLLAHVVPDGGLVSGTSSVMRLDGWTREDIAVVPRAGIVVTWPAMDVVTAPWVKKSAEEQKKEIESQIALLDDLFRDARAYSLAARAGIDTNKRDIRMEAMRMVFESEMRVFVEAQSQRQIESALDFAEKYQLKLVIVGGYDARYVTDRLKKQHVPVIVQRVHALPRREDEGYDATYTLPVELAKAGVEFCLSDGGAWQQRNLPNQAGSLMAFGMKETDAVKAITLSAARILGIDDRYGSIEVGKSATLFVCDGDALDGKSNVVTHAWIDGRSVDLNNRHKTLAKKYRTRPAR
ncbi:MAG: amidohydrolase family protein [Ignavibacteria bacterium]|nr:amidohydrolase family protein [Ignavibacteria bacterium]